MNDLIGKSWAMPCDPPNTFDCWELVVEVRRRLGLATKAYSVAPARRTVVHRRALANPDPKVWHKLSGPHSGCLVGFGTSTIKHCGVYLHGRIMHAAHGQGVVYQGIDTVVGFYGPVSYWEMVDGTD